MDDELPEPGSWVDIRRRRAEEKARSEQVDNDRPYAAFAAALLKARKEKPDVGAAALGAIDMIEAALADDRLSLEALREALRPVLLLCPRPPIDPARARHIETWLGLVAESWRAPGPWDAPADHSPVGAEPPDRLPPTPVTAADAAASAKLLKEAIEAGTVVELPSGARIRHERKKP
jgi:hypothetical protein